jgi:hypothetical protein
MSTLYHRSDPLLGCDSQDGDAIADLGDLIEDRRQVGGVHISDGLTSWVSLTFDSGAPNNQSPENLSSFAAGGVD